MVSFYETVLDAEQARLKTEEIITLHVKLVKRGNLACKPCHV